MSLSQIIKTKNRQFICSCNKTYLSYPALFTHIKQKHGGKAPGQIVRPRTSNKRGRPRKYKLDQTGIEYSSLENKNRCPNNFQKFHQGFDENDKIRDFQGLFQKDRDGSEGFKIYNSQSFKNQIRINQKYDYKLFPNQSSQQNQSQDNKKQKVVCQGLHFVLQGIKITFQDLKQIKQKILNNQTLRKLKEIQKKSTNSQQYNKSNQIFKVTIGNAINQFFLSIQQKLNPQQFIQVQIVILLLLQYIGSELGNQDFLNNHYIYQVIQFISKFLQFFLVQQQIQCKSLQNIQILKNNNPMRVLIWFFNWLTSKNYTYFQKQINEQNKTSRNESDIKDLQKYKQINVVERTCNEI